MNSNKPLCQWCKKTFYSLKNLEKHSSKCKIKKQVDEGESIIALSAQSSEAATSPIEKELRDHIKHVEQQSFEISSRDAMQIAALNQELEMCKLELENAKRVIQKIKALVE